MSCFEQVTEAAGESAVDKTTEPEFVFAIRGYSDQQVRRLVIRPGAIGDFIVSLPAIECLRCKYLEVWTSAVTNPLVRFAHRVRSIASTGLDLLSVAQPPPTLIEHLRSFDSIVSWYGANREEFRAEVARLSLPFQFFDALPAEGSSVHAADFYLSQVRAITMCASDGIPRIAVATQKEDFAVIHPFSGSARKNWPLENFSALATEISRDTPVHWCAGPDDPPLDGAVRIDNLWDLAQWLAKAQLFVGNDSGITHLAAAVGIPVLALFGSTDPDIWAPRGARIQIGRF